MQHLEKASLYEEGMPVMPPAAQAVSFVGKTLKLKVAQAVFEGAGAEAVEDMLVWLVSCEGEVID